MRSFVPSHRRPPQIIETDAPKSHASHQRESSFTYAPTDAASEYGDAAPSLHTTQRAVSPLARIPIFPHASLSVDARVGVVQRKGDAPVNKTGMPDTIKAGIESLSGMAMDDVKVHYNSSKPAQLQALAYAQGSDIHLGPGQDAHVAHEAWHVVQQKQGRVRATRQIEGQAVNDDAGLEREAETMGRRAMSQPASGDASAHAEPSGPVASGDVAQLVTIRGTVVSPTGAKVYKSIGTINSDAIGGKRVAKGTRVRIDSETSVEKYEHVTIDDAKLVDGSPMPTTPNGFVDGYINRDKLEFAESKSGGSGTSTGIKKSVLDEVDAWLLAEARASGKEKLITEGGYDALSDFRKIEVFRRAGVAVNINDASSFKKLKNGIISDKIDWVAFSAIVRRINGNASAQKIFGAADAQSAHDPAATGGKIKTGQTPFATTSSEYVGYVGLGGGAAASAASAITAQTEHSSANLVTNVGNFHQSGAAQAMQGTDIAGGALATVANITEIIRTLETIKEKSSANIAFSEAPYILDQVAQIGTSAGRIVASVAGVQGHFSLAQVGYDQAAAASASHSALFLIGAQVTGILSAVAGAAKMAKGIYDVAETTAILNNLLRLKGSLTSPDFKVMLAHSQESQALKRTVAGATIVQGAAMVAGGIMV
nr:DUF4157 domain-containing protein [Chloroflexota bacterium]